MATAAAAQPQTGTAHKPKILRIGIIQAGQLLAEGTLEELRARAGDGARSTLEDVFLDLTAEKP